MENKLIVYNISICLSFLKTIKIHIYIISSISKPYLLEDSVVFHVYPLYSILFKAKCCIHFKYKPNNWVVKRAQLPWLFFFLAKLLATFTSVCSYFLQFLSSSTSLLDSSSMNYMLNAYIPITLQKQTNFLPNSRINHPTISTNFCAKLYFHLLSLSQTNSYYVYVSKYVQCVYT